MPSSLPLMRFPRRKRPLSNGSTVKSPAAASTATDEAPKGKPAPWRALFFFTTKRNVPLLIFAILFSILAGAVDPAQAYIMGKFFDGFSQYATGKLQGDAFMDYERKWIFYMIALGGASWMTNFLEFGSWMAFGELQARSARDRLFYGLMEREIEWYDMRKNGIGAMLPRLQAQIRDLQVATSQPFGMLFTIMSTAILSLVQALVKAWDLTLVTIASIPVVLIAITWAGNKVQAHTIAQQDALTEAQKFAANAFGAIETVKCYNGQDDERKKYMAKISKAARWYYHVASAAALQLALIALLTVSMFVQGFYYGSVIVRNGKSTPGDVITTFFSAIGAFTAINSIMPQLMVLEKGRTAGGVLRAIVAQVHEGPDVRRRSGNVAPATCRGDIEVRDLTFAYPARSDKPAIQNVTLSIPAGDMTFLIGKSGSGKSTIGQLLMRFYHISSGSISVDGVSLESIDVNWLRSNVTLVEQTSLLFNDTLARNVAFGRKDFDKVTKDEIVAATEFALLQLMVSDMPKGYETLVGHKGGSMSGGQRQRMALARARLRDTPLLILDESTSALDRISRALMMDAIRAWRRGKTTIVITHDISQILPDDYVFLLEHGRLVQEGYRKHMEKLKNTPFQMFLPEEERATVSPFDARKASGYETIATRGTSLDSINRHFSDITFDPMEAQLDAGDIKYALQSYFPKVLTEGTPFPAMRGTVHQGGAVTAFASSLMRLTAASPPFPVESKGPTPGSRWSGWFGKKDEAKSPQSPESGRSRTRWSTIMQTVVDRTGQAALDSRRAPDGIRRRREQYVELESVAETTTSKAKETSPEDDGFPDGEHRSYKQILKTIWPNVDWTVKLVIIIGFFACSIHATVSPVFSFLLSKLLAIYNIPGGDRKQSLMYSMIMLGLSFTDAISTYIYKFSLEYAGQRWVDSLRSKAITRILDQPREFFEKQENAVTHLAASLDRNAEEMRNLLGRFLALIWIAMLMCSVSLIWSMIAQWKLTLIALSAAPYFAFVTKVFASVSETWEGRANDAADGASAIFTETFTNIRTVRALTLEQHFLDKYVKATERTLQVGFRRSLLCGFFFGLSDSAATLCTAMIFYVGTTLVKQGTDVQKVILVFTQLVFTITNMSSILAYIPQMSSSKDTGSRLLRLAELPEDSHEHFGDTRITTVGEIVFDDLYFSYPSRPEQTILTHIKLRIKPGTTTAIVGGSGSGKSTIANLLLNLYTTASHPDDAYHRTGDLTLSGRDINNIHTPSLRALVVPVSQTPTLFAATMAENIRYGLPADSPHNTTASVVSAAQQAGIHDFITSLPQGYDTPIGDGGMGLSGGQAQRVAIARALIRKPAVLILDEATSALDVESANLVRQTLESLVHNKYQQHHKHLDTNTQHHGQHHPNRKASSPPMTIIIITHGREMMSVADNIVVLDQGRIVEEGGFEELMARKGGALVNLLSGGEWTGEEAEGEERSGRRQFAGERERGVPVLGEVEWGRKKGRGRGRGRGGGS